MKIQSVETYTSRPPPRRMHSRTHARTHLADRDYAVARAPRIKAPTHHAESATLIARPHPSVRRRSRIQRRRTAAVRADARRRTSACRLVVVCRPFPGGRRSDAALPRPPRVRALASLSPRIRPRFRTQRWSLGLPRTPAPLVRPSSRSSARSSTRSYPHRRLSRPQSVDVHVTSERD
jgi:hypothetical protein